MSKENAKTKNVAPVSPADLLQLRDALSMKFGVYLRPGEGLSLDADRSAEHAHAVVVLTSSDETSFVEVEAASVPEDQDAPAEWDAEEALVLVIDLIDIHLEEFFEEERVPRFHDDWRPYDLEGQHLRLRGVHTRPQLDALADAWLAAGGDPDAQPAEDQTAEDQPLIDQGGEN